jgi:hypothetical protein
MYWPPLIDSVEPVMAPASLSRIASGDRPVTNAVHDAIAASLKAESKRLRARADELRAMWNDYVNREGMTVTTKAFAKALRGPEDIPDIMEKLLADHAGEPSACGSQLAEMPLQLQLRAMELAEHDATALTRIRSAFDTTPGAPRFRWMLRPLRGIVINSPSMWATPS